MVKKNNRLSLEKTSLMTFALGLILFGFADAVFGFLLHVEDAPEFSNSNIFNIAFISVIFIILAFRMWRRLELKDVTFFSKNVKGAPAFLFQWALITGMVFGVHAITSLILRPITYAVQPWEIFLYYVTIAIAEETMYRIFLFTIFYRFFNFMFRKMKNKKIKEWTVNAIVIIITSIIFASTHYAVYGQEPLLMLATFITGMIWGFAVAYFKNPAITLLSHMTINGVVAGFDIITGII